MTERAPAPLRMKVLLALGSLLVTFTALETAARVWITYLASPEQFSKFASLAQYRARAGGDEWWFGLIVPRRYVGYALAPNLVDGPNRHDALGFRGEDFPIVKPPGETRIACLGASTTYTILVPDYRRAYPQVMEANLRAGGANVRVLNAGVPAWSSYESLIDYLIRIEDLAPDVVVISQNFGDLAARMVWPPEAYKGDNSGYFAQQFAVHDAPLWESSALLRILLVSSGRALPASAFGKSVYNPASTAYFFEFARQRWSMTFPTGIFEKVTVAEMLRANPPVYFRRNTESLVAIVQARGQTPVLLTFPYCEAITGYFGVEGFREAVDEQNEILKEIGKVYGVPVLDLAAVFPKDKRYWAFDGIHMSEEGAALEGKLVADFLRERGLVPK